MKPENSNSDNFIYQSALCGIGICNSIISYCAAEMGLKFFSYYYGVGPSNVLFLACDTFKDPDHEIGSIAGFAASWAVNSWAGAKIGACFGGVVGAIAGAVIGFAVGYCVNQIVNKITDDFRTCSGIFSWRSPGGNGGPGGVEFRKVNSFSGFNRPNIILSRKCNIFFETDNERLTREAFNSLCLPMFQNRSMKEYFETIMMEIFEISLNGGELPFVSLHFNNDGLLYSVMNPLFKQTLIGNTLAFLDYFLKGFVNGGFFNIQFIKKWKLNPITDLNKLNDNLIDVRKQLKKIRSGYKSLYSLLDQDEYGDEFTSAFRIIGEISNVCQMSGHTILPSSDFIVESDLFPSASFQRILNIDYKAKEKWLRITVAHNRMKSIIKQLMPFVPQFTGYFEILKMICFALYYTESLDSVGLKAETNSAFQNQPSPYVDIIPDIFPPLPVRKSIKIDLKITVGDIIKTVSAFFDKELYQIMNENISDFTENCYNAMENEISKIYKQRISTLAYSQGILHLDDEDIELNSFLMLGMMTMKNLKSSLMHILVSFYCSFIEQIKDYLLKIKDIIKIPSIIELDLFKIKEIKSSIPQLRTRCKKILHMITRNGIDQFVNKLIPDSFRQEEVKTANAHIEMQRNTQINNLNNCIEKMQRLLETLTANFNKCNELENQYNALDNISKNYPQNLQVMKDVWENKPKYEKNIQDINTEIRKIKSEMNRINREANSIKTQNIKNNIKIRDSLRQNIHDCITEFKAKYQLYNDYYHKPSHFFQNNLDFSKNTIEWEVSISTPIIINGKNSTSIRGGCLINSYKSSSIINQELTINDERKIEKYVSKGRDIITLCDKKGFLVNARLQSYKYSMITFSESKENEDLKKFVKKYGLSMKHIKLFSGIVDTSLSKMPLNQLKERTANNIPAISLACCNGSIKSIDLFMKKGQDFGEVQYNGIYPFLEVMANEYHDAALHILSNNAKISNINRSTETGVTPLLWAVYYGWDDITKLLISRGASTIPTLKNNGMTPIHLACFHDQPKCLFELMKASDCKYDKSLSGITPFHVAAAHSINCAMILIQNGKANFNIKDSNDHTSRDIAVLNGQYEIAKNIPKYSQTIHFNINSTGLNTNQKTFDYKSLCQSFSSGDVQMTKKILTKINQQEYNLKQNDEKYLIECACQGRCTEFIEFLSTIIQLDKYPIAVITAYYGIINWLKELKKYGADFSVNDYCFLDEAINNGDDQFLKEALNIIDNIPETVWKRIINQSVKINDQNVMLTISNYLQNNDKYASFRLTAKDIITHKTTSLGFLCFVKFIIPESLEKLSSFIDMLSIKLLQFLLKYMKFNNVEIKKSIIHSFRKNRLDISYVMLKEYPQLHIELCTKISELKRLTSENLSITKCQIQKLLKTNKKDAEKVDALNYIFQITFNIGLLDIFSECSLLDISGVSISFFWILKCLPDEALQEFCFYDHFDFNNQFLPIFSFIFDIFEKRFGDNAGSIFLRSLRKIDFDELDEQHYGDNFISSLLDIMMKSNNVKYIKSVDDENQTLFHIAAKFGYISNKTLDMLIEKIKVAKVSWKNLLNIRTQKGKTILMIFAGKGNIEAIKRLVQLKDNIETRDIYGNNILHEILQDAKMTNDKLIEGIVHIGNTHRELIIQRNRKEENAFFLAAKRGFNGVLGAFSMYYPASFLDNLDENCVESSLHIAAKKNYFETVRYLVQSLHLDLHIKTNDCFGLMPIHFAAMYSSLDTFNEIIKLGGNPLAEDFSGKNAFYYALAFGERHMISQITKMPSFLYELSSPQILIPIVQNSEAASLFLSIIHLIDPSSIRTCDERGMTLLSLAVEHDNRQIVDRLLNLGIDPAKKANNGQNSIHVCAKNDAIGCSTLIIKFLLLTKGADVVIQILNSSDNEGNLPIHIAALKGYSGYVSHLLSSCKEIDLGRSNHEGHSPISIAYKNGYHDVAVIMENYYLSHKFKSKIRNTDKYLNNWELSKDLADLWKINEELNTISKEEYQIKKIDQTPTNNQGSIINVFAQEMGKLFINISDEILEKFSQVFNNGYFNAKLITLAQDKKIIIVKKIIKQMKNFIPSKINLIAYLIIFPQLQDNEMNEFIEYINSLNKINVQKTHPIYHWIINGLVSAVELKSTNYPLMPSIKIIVDFVNRVYNNSTLRKAIKYPNLPLPIHIIAHWLMNFNDTWLKVQLQFMDKMSINVFFEKEQNLSVDFCNSLDYDQYKLVNFIIGQKKRSLLLDPMIEFREYVIHSIHATLELYEDPDLQNDVKNALLDKCIEICKKKMFTAKSLTKWISLTKRVIDDFGLKYLIDIINIIPQESLEIANNALSLIISIGSPKKIAFSIIKRGIHSIEAKYHEIENEKYMESRNLDEILNAFKKQSKEFIPYKFTFDGTPIVELSQSDRNKLHQFGKILELKVKIDGTLKDAAYEVGKNFRDKPNIENAAKLIGIIRLVIQDTLNLKPFIVQCLAVGALLLHRVNHPVGLKGRIAQIATGEGKSIIVAMLAAAIGLTGSFVDVISSSFYLAERDAEKFEQFYEKLGLKCGTLDENESNPCVDFHIIYSTNSGFEFAFLREGISGKNTLAAVPLHKNSMIRRSPMTAIVDEADNLFIDSATNSARIASGSSSQYTWVFSPFFHAVIENKVSTKEQARKFLSKIAQTQSQKDSLAEISDHQLGRWIENAKYANNVLQKDVDYVVGFNNDKQQYEIQIVDQQNTGRINIGCRWTEGLHEFVEVKENLQVQPQSLTIAAISHPSFFSRYQEIYGLTGTLGEEIERKEIKEIYNVDSFDVPPNRICLRKRTETLIVPNDDKKHELIISKIKEITKQQRPILVIVLTIQESQQLSEKLKAKSIKHFVLNDTQSEDEDFIIDRAGKCGAVTIATNTAGRGTDIKLEKMAVKYGGLHVVIAFFPVNMRVECQGLGRAGRQGQPGSCQIIFSSKLYAGISPKASEEALRQIYQNRTKYVRISSVRRMMNVKKEHLLFNALISYFKYYAQLRTFLESPHGEQLIRSFGGENLGDHYDSESILNDLSLKWSQFYTRISNGDIELKVNSFDSFRQKYEEKMIILAMVFNENIRNIDSTSPSIYNESIDPLFNESFYLTSNKAFNNDNSIHGFSGSKPLSKT